jgi:ubiquinone/menaquinone biosynthesis C-methylase UbiE
MKWSRSEINRLLPILEQISSDLAPVDGKNILVLCSDTGEVVFWLGEMMEQGHVVGLELDQEALGIAQRSAHEMGLEQMVELLPAEKQRIPLPDSSFDALVSEFIVYPTSTPTEISQPEMARVLKPGGKMILTDVIVTSPLPGHIRQALAAIGMDYLCDGTADDFHRWMADAGLVNINVQDLTPLVRSVWEDKHATDLVASHEKGYSYLLDDPQTGLGNEIYYLYVHGEKPKDPL